VTERSELEKKVHTLATTVNKALAEILDLIRRPDQTYSDKPGEAYPPGFTRNKSGTETAQWGGTTTPKLPLQQRRTTAGSIGANVWNTYDVDEQQKALVIARRFTELQERLNSQGAVVEDLQALVQSQTNVIDTMDTAIGALANRLAKLEALARGEGLGDE